jgi:copper resistance protein B
VRVAFLPSFAAVLLAAPAVAQNKHEAHPERTFTMVRTEIDWAGRDGEDVVNWEGDAWIGGDRNRLWIKTGGEIEAGDTHAAEVEALWSRAVGTFWDVQVGLRQDVAPTATTYLVAGLHGLAPYQFESETFAYLSEDGTLSARFEQGIELHVTQDLILEPEFELEASAADVAERGVGAGLTEVGVSAQLRYEITRKFAPYVEVAYERRLGETAALARSDGDRVDETLVKVGLRTWF